MPLAAWCMTRDTLRDLAAAVIAAANTDAGAAVYGPDTLPVTPDKLPAVVIACPSERKDTAGEGAPQFVTTMALAIMARTSAKSEGETEVALGRLVDQLQRAILCTPAMIAPVQRFAFVETHGVVTNKGSTFIGEATLIIGCEVQQLYEPDAGEPLAGFTVTTARPPGQGPVFKSFLQT